MDLDRAAVRRHPRAQGDEPRDGPRGRAARAGADRSRVSTPTDLLPDTLLPELTAENYTPFQKPPFAGDVEAAKAEMKQSKYDTDQDGLCDAARVQGHRSPQPQLRARGRRTRRSSCSRPPRSASSSRRARPRARPSTTRRARPAREIPISSGNGWGKDYADPVHLHGAVRRPQHPGRRQHRLRPRRADPAKAKEVGVDDPGERRRRASTPTSTTARRCPTRSGPTAGSPWTRSSWRRSCRGSPLMDATDDRPDRSGGDAVRLRPVRNRDGAGQVAVNPALQK